MQKQAIEKWALEVIERVRKHQPDEDSRVELKSEWKPAAEWTRQLSGHANAAQGEDILWLIGVDRSRGVTGAQPMELANWEQQLCAQFDQVAPSLTDVSLSVQGLTVVALCFETDQAPFVVKAPRGSTPEREVPWREGTSTRSAYRRELLKLLVPPAQLPSIDVCAGELAAELMYAQTEFGEYEEWVYWKLHLQLYMVPKGRDQVAIPYHSCLGNIEIVSNGFRAPLGEIGFQLPDQTNWSPLHSKLRPLSTTSSSSLLRISQTELLVDGPGAVYLVASARTNVPEGSLGHGDVRLHIELFPINISLPVSVNATLGSSAPRGSDAEDYTNLWGLWRELRDGKDTISSPMS